jgi:hypothetical protein
VSDLGPFAIRRIESGASSGAPTVASSADDAPASPVLKRAAEVYVERLTGAVERGSPVDAQVAESLRTQSAAIDAETLTPLLAGLASPPSLVIPVRAHDALAPATSSSRDVTGASIDPSADAMRTSVFHPLADFAAAPDPGARGEARTSGRAPDTPADRLQPLLDKFLKST